MFDLEPSTIEHLKLTAILILAFYAGRVAARISRNLRQMKEEKNSKKS